MVNGTLKYEELSILDQGYNASISEPGQMSKNGSAADRSMTIRPGIEMPDVVPICFAGGGSDLIRFRPDGSGITH